MTLSHTTLVVEHGHGGRLDTYLSHQLDLSRTRVQKLIADDRVRVDGRRARKSEPVEEGTRIEVEIPPPEATGIEAEDLPLSIVYQDEHLAVVDKAAGMVVHPAPGNRTGTMVNALLHHLDDLSEVGGRARPGIVHRLDRDTSGLLVVAKTDRAHRGLAEDLRKRLLKRLYVAAAWGHLDEAEFMVDAPIGRDPVHRRRMAVIPDGRRAVSHMRVVERWTRADLVHVALETGRTHQIRVHLAHLGHPVVGDEQYGVGWERGMGGPAHGWAKALARRAGRHFLHAKELAFDHPVSGRRMEFEAPLPPDLAAIHEWARGENADDGLARGGGSEE